MDYTYHSRDLYDTWEEYVRTRYNTRIVDECKNFVFLDDGSMVYDYREFDSYWDAMIDAVKNGEDIDRIIHLVFHEKVDWPIVKGKLLKEINK